MTIHLTTATRNAMLDAITTAIDLGSGAGYIEVRSGTQPANANTSATGTVLATIPLMDPVGAASSGGVLTFGTTGTTDSSADATGTASWARVYDSTGTAVLDGSVGTSGADFTISSTSIVAGQTVTLTSGTLTLVA